MATSIPCCENPLPPIQDTDEGASPCSSSSEEEYHIHLKEHEPDRTFPSLKFKLDQDKVSQPAESLVAKRQRYQKSTVSACNLLRAAKLAQAAGRSSIQKVPGQLEYPRKKLHSDANPYTANPIHALTVQNTSSGPKACTEPIFAASATNLGLSLSNSKTLSADYVKLEKAFRAVDTMAVVGRLCRVDGVMPDIALHVVYEYLRFLILLIRCQDWNATMLWPSPMVDLAWRQHVLDTVRYLSDCQSICGRFIHYNPDAELGGQHLCSMKYSRTLSLYKSVFGAPPVVIWPTEQDLNPNLDFLHNPPIASLSENNIELICRVPTGATKIIEVNLNIDANQIFNRLKNWEEVSPESHILVFNGDIMDTSVLLKNFELRQGMTIDVIPAINAR